MKTALAAVPKTGTSFVVEAYRRADIDLPDKHTIKDADRRITIIRNPFTWLPSVYRWMVRYWRPRHPDAPPLNVTIEPCMEPWRDINADSFEDMIMRMPVRLIERTFQPYIDWSNVIFQNERLDVDVHTELESTRIWVDDMPPRQNVSCYDEPCEWDDDLVNQVKATQFGFLDTYYPETI